MEEKGDKRSPSKLKYKPVRQISEEAYWDCSVCTYRNTSEAFKCSMCDVRKGTSTRKPRINAHLVAQQVAHKYIPNIPGLKKAPSKRPLKKMRPRLQNVDRSSAQHMAVTVGNVTVIITDYKLLKPEHTSSCSPDRNSPGLSEGSYEAGPSTTPTEYIGNGASHDEST
ncbi:YY1-associated factor 2 [Nematostella vectensis]|uniref:YY1-associated factor 2 n=1 Tax=Nematostella vectensis TaxID=45351 RepID=UPI0020772259|nr:YY1-associated factor 2 [Nematostella vectensis]